jgi:ribosomal protein L40E
MENTALTRQATRARIGPWYVMQARNPAAPGMKCNTLLGLIRKGQVTPKTVVRGPTTHQFWRFAARVKGISREFGICFSCGTRLDTKAVECPHCGKSQELPSNPDTLLEGDFTPVQPVFREVKPTPAPADVSHGEPSAPEETASLGIENHKPRRPPTPEEPLLNLEGAEEYSVTPASPLPAPERAPIASGPRKPNLAALKTADGDSPPQSRRRIKQHENVLTARDLATAFSLQYEPHAPTPAKNKSKLRRAIVMTVVVLLIGGGAAVWFVPSLQERAIALFHQIYPSAIAAPPANFGPAAHVGTATPSDAPPWSARLPKTEVPITTPTPSDASAGSSPNVANAAAAADSGTATASDDDLDALAMRLHNQGLDAEARHDYASAAAYYQQIEKLPREHWPADTEQLLGAARQRLAASGGQ